MFAFNYPQSGKRLLDLVIVIPALVTLSPFLALVAVVVRLSSPGPVLFIQTRVGLEGRLFRSYKFRSMYLNDVDPNAPDEVYIDNPLITPIGRFIRRSKIDELPQLWNILLGDMTLVGPRPTLPEQVAEYSRQQRARLDVLPGLTGWAQVNGNIELSWHERIQLDLWYIDHQSIWLDLRIIWMTLAVILQGEQPKWEALYAAGIRRSS